MTRGASAEKKVKRNHVVVIICNRDKIEAVQDSSALLRCEETGESEKVQQLATSWSSSSHRGNPTRTSFWTGP